MNQFRATRPACLWDKRESWIVDLNSFISGIAMGLRTAQKSQTGDIKELMFETANNVRGLQVRSNSTKKELERIGSSMREIQHSTTGGKIEELHSLSLKSIETAKRSAIPIVSSASGSTLSSEKVMGMLCDGMLLASKLSVRAKLDDHSVMVANVDFRKAAKLIIRGGGLISKGVIKETRAEIREELRHTIVP